MGLADLHAAQAATRVPRPRPTVPTGYEPHIRYDAGQAVEVSINLPKIEGDEQQWRDAIREHAGITVPEDRQVTLTQVRLWGRPEPDPETGASRMFHYARFTITDRPETASAETFTELAKVARAARTRKTKVKAGARTRVVVVADAQIHKQDHRGGWPQFLDRTEHLLAQLEDRMRAVPCEDALILDPGDLIEGFSNTKSQARMNTGSLPQQILDAQRFLTRWVERIADRVPGSTRVAAVPSNHSRWSEGKELLGTPGDDFGLAIHQGVAETFARMRRDDVTFIIPESTWDETLALQVRGAVIGLAHGHRAGTNANQVPAWWARQTHGGMPLAAATILVTGHWHHLKVEPTGQIDGRDRWWFQAPTLDNGSAWWANGGGAGDSQPGLLTFTVDDAGDWADFELIRDTRRPETGEAA
ncbi:hypothetical protein DNL40_02420 [Xylanimonas oleitrophica]|uniref:Uncharacterized protein n=1 Tax=Xylanimonas oleitrophica TaxID=2607479 RepID=A0A2W5X465_9MICO|nr:hypothetical protein [Xylanimonas oleitrophica]PZR55245.1 hypothetical protein DNL40_02420 [Xylanimonas oleitrophica]